MLRNVKIKEAVTAVLGKRWLYGSGENMKCIFLINCGNFFSCDIQYICFFSMCKISPSLLTPPTPRVLPLSVYIWYRESHQPVQHQWCSGSPCCPHQHHPEGPAVRRGWSQHQWGGTRTRFQKLSSSLLCLLSHHSFLPSPVGRHIIWRAAHWVSVPDRCGDARRGSDEAAGLPGQNGPAAGRRIGAGIGHRGQHHRQRQERREYCQRGGERSPCLS